MKTVKEFKDAGLEFVDGDLIDGVTGQDSSQAVELMGVSKDICGVGPSGFWTLREFAWRTNTGERPSFSGVVEVEFRLGTNKTSFLASVLDWSIEGYPGDIIKWRPVISEESKIEGKTNNPRVSEREDIPECNPEIKIISNASDCDVTTGKPWMEGFNCQCVMVDIQQAKKEPKLGDRQWFNGKECELTNIEVGCQTWTPIEDLKQEPAFTKEMHEAGELPPVGSMFTVEPNTHLAMKCLYSSKFCVIGLLDSGLECVFDLHRQDVKYEFKPIDTRTEEEKLVDEIMEFIDVEPYDRIKPKSLIYRIIKAGYCKPKEVK